MHKRRTASLRPARTACLCLCLGLGAPTSFAAAGDAAEALVFEAQNDGRCQILSEGGKLVVLRNTHAEDAIRYRLVRQFAGVPQGRIDGEIRPGEAPQKLGCNRVNGRLQTWKVERATRLEKSP